MASDSPVLQHNRKPRKQRALKCLKWAPLPPSPKTHWLRAVGTPALRGVVLSLLPQPDKKQTVHARRERQSSTNRNCCLHYLQVGHGFSPSPESPHTHTPPFFFGLFRVAKKTQNPWIGRAGCITLPWLIYSKAFYSFSFYYK